MKHEQLQQIVFHFFNSATKQNLHWFWKFYWEFYVDSTSVNLPDYCTPWLLDWMDTILWAIFVFCLKFHWSLFLRVQLTISQYQFRWLLGAYQSPNSYLNSLAPGRFQFNFRYRKISNIRCTKSPNLNLCFPSRLAVVFAQYIEAKC